MPLFIINDTLLNRKGCIKEKVRVNLKKYTRAPGSGRIGDLLREKAWNFRRRVCKSLSMYEYGTKGNFGAVCFAADFILQILGLQVREV